MKVIDLTDDMFDPVITPLTSREQAEEVASIMPIRIDIGREFTSTGKYRRTIKINTNIYYRNINKIEYCSEITPALLEADTYEGAYYVSEKQREFDDFEEAERWIKKTIEYLTEIREKFLEKRRWEKESEVVVIY